MGKCLICDLPAGLEDSHETEECPHGDGLEDELGN